jgi:signal transduction histidine kinase
MGMMEQYAAIPEPVPVHPGLESLEDGFFMVDAEWRLSYWNAAAANMLDVARESVLGQDLWTALPFLRDTSSWDVLRRVRRAGTPRRYLDLFAGHLPGFVSIYAAPLADGGLSVQFRDATDEVKQTEQYSALLESIQDGFVAVDDRWRVIYLNSIAESLLRLPRERAQNVSLWSLMPGDGGEISACLRATMSDGVKRHLRTIRPPGPLFRRRAYDLWTYPLAGGGISILFEDVTKRLRRERKLARLAAEAEEASRAKSRFFAAISHELRTPLNAIVGYTHLLSAQTYGPMPDGARRAADRAGMCAEHLSRLVDDVLVLTGTELNRIPVVPVQICLPELLERASRPYRDRAEAKGLCFDLLVAAEVSEVETDPDRLRQLVGSLLSNAVKFTTRGGVRLEARPHANDDARGAECEPPWVEIAVEDTGPGIDLQDRERIFEAFEQVGDPARSTTMIRGSGLGLPIARELATLLGGTLILSETSPAGSTFCLRLPAVPHRN